MTSVNVQLLLHYVLIICIDKFHETKAQIRYESYENESVPNTREIYSGTHSSRGDLPTSFKAPDFASRNYWNDLSSRRTFLGDSGYSGYRRPGILPALNKFYDFMNSFIDRGNIFREPQPAVPKKVPEPYPYEYPFDVYSTTERNFLPPPKPIRASIVKLETVTRGPETFVRVQPNFRPIPTAKPNFNAFHIDELGFHSATDIHFHSEPHLNLPIPEGKLHGFDNVNSTIYTESPAGVYVRKIKTPFAEGDERAPSTRSPEISTALNIRDLSETEPETSGPVPKSEIFNRGKSKGDSRVGEGTARDGSLEFKNVENSNAAINAKEESKSDEKKSFKKVKPDKITNSIKIVTELTLEGLSENKTEMVNIPAYTKHINMSGLINYELNKLKENKVIKPRWDLARENNTDIDPEDFLSPPVNSNDELSLDLKILKDTNWDGFTTEISKPKQFSTPGEDHFSNANSSDISHGRSPQQNATTEARAHDNNTIIVETRVTKSITKAIPISTLNRDYFISKNQSNNFKSGGGILDNEEGKSYILISDPTNGEYPENYNFSNKTMKLYEKLFNDSREGELIRRFNRSESIDPIANGIPESKPILQNVFNSSKAPEIIDNAGAVDPKQKTDSYLGNFKNYTIYTSTSGGEPIIFENKTSAVTIKQLRKRKHKRLQKNKRRRTGKRRQSTSTTTQIPITNNNNNTNNSVSQQTNTVINVDP